MFTTTFTFTFTDLLYTTIFAGKKVNIVSNLKIDFMRFNAYGKISSSS